MGLFSYKGIEIENVIDNRLFSGFGVFVVGLGRHRRREHIVLYHFT